MGHADLAYFPHADALIHKVARRWIDAVRAAAGADRAFCVALSGGRIAAPFFTALAALATAERSPLGQVAFFWADERCVPPDHPESNFRLAQEHLFTPLNLPKRQIHRLAGERDPAVAARQAAEELRNVALINANGQPVLDLVILGLGEDGHVASLFPGAALEATTSQAVYVAVIGPKPPPQRLTLTYPMLAAAREVWTLVAGPGKARILTESLSPLGRTPLARVIASRPKTSVFATQED